MYLIRLDDASEYMDNQKWNRMEYLLDEFDIKPIVGIIPNNQDSDLISNYPKDVNFWSRAKKWQSKNWSIAMHGYNHVYLTNSSGINPVNKRSEFAGVSLEEQKQKISKARNIFDKHNIYPNIFFAPSHTFDMNTLNALKAESNIRVISDTVANDVYKMRDFYFIPQQSGRVQNLPFKVTTFCYHPNNMQEEDFIILEKFIKSNKEKFGCFDDLSLKDRKYSLYDRVLRNLYFTLRKVRNKLKKQMVKYGKSS